MSEWHRFHRRQHESVNEWVIWPGKWLDLGPIKLIEIFDFAGPSCMWATERDIDYVQLQALDIAALSSLLLCSFTTWSKVLEIFHKNPESDFCPQHQWHSDKSQTEKSHCLKWSILSAASKSRNYHICTNPISLGNTATAIAWWLLSPSTGTVINKTLWNIEAEPLQRGWHLSLSWSR